MLLPSVSWVNNTIFTYLPPRCQEKNEQYLLRWYHVPLLLLLVVTLSKYARANENVEMDFRCKSVLLEAQQVKSKHWSIAEILRSWLDVILFTYCPFFSNFIQLCVKIRENFIQLCGSQYSLAPFKLSEQNSLCCKQVNDDANIWLSCFCLCAQLALQCTCQVSRCVVPSARFQVKNRTCHRKHKNANDKATCFSLTANLCGFLNFYHSVSKNFCFLSSMQARKMQATIKTPIIQDCE